MVSLQTRLKSAKNRDSGMLVPLDGGCSAVLFRTQKVQFQINTLQMGFMAEQVDLSVTAGQTSRH